MSELINSEAARLSEGAFDGINDKPQIFDINKAFVGLQEVFPGTTSKVGFNSFYLDKQLGFANPGDIPDLSNFNSSEHENEEIEFVVEKYVDASSKDSVSLSLIDGENSTATFQSEVQALRTINPGTYLSDYFGNLEFAYEGSLRELFDKGFANQESILKLWEINGKNDEILTSLQNSLTDYIMSKNFEDIDVVYDSSFLLEGDEVEPSKTLGSLGVSYGLKISCIIPQNMSPTGESIKIKLMSVEVEAVDMVLEEFSINKLYDLECLIIKMTDSEEFSLMFNKCIPLKMMTSAIAIFYMENFMKALGENEAERSEDYITKKNRTFNDGIEDSWEGIMNETLKGYLRREFASTYLSNDINGFSFEGLSERERTRLFGSFNPFDVFSLPSVKIPWFRRRRFKTKVYDAFGNECASPEKDFE